MRRLFGIGGVLVLLGSCGALGAQPLTKQEQRVKSLIEAADRERKIHGSRAGAKAMILADAEATKLERHARAQFAGYRSIKLAGHKLQFDWIDFWGKEQYHHDLILSAIEMGPPGGADALATLLRFQHYDVFFSWVWSEELVLPKVERGMLYKGVIELLESEPWEGLHDPRLERVLAEAYETWWCLSLNHTEELDPYGFGIGDFGPGSEEARQKAIELYRRVLRTRPSDAALAKRLSDIEHSVDTHQVNWFTPGD